MGRGPGHNGRYAAAARPMAAAAVVVVMLSLLSCGKELKKEGAVYTCEEYTVYPDSFSSPSLTIMAEGDSMILAGNGMTRREAICRSGSGVMTMTGSDTLLNYLFNRVTATDIDPGDEFTSLEIFIADGLLSPDSAAAVVDRRIVAGKITESVRDGYHWPVVMTDATWGLAAATVSSMTADSLLSLKRAMALKRLVDTDMDYVYDVSEGLFKGCPAEMSTKQLPAWVNAGDMADMMTLSGNVARYAAMRYVNRLRPGSYNDLFIDRLSANISKRFYIPNLSFLSQTLYQRPDPIAVTATDNMAQALAVVTASVGAEMSRRIISGTPVNPGEVPVTYPAQGLQTDRKRRALTNALWAMAAAVVDNEEAWALGFGALVAEGVADAYALRLLKGVMLRTIFGLNPVPGGMEIHPVVHSVLGDTHRVTGIRYRNATLNITVRGKGSVVSNINLDGRVMGGTRIPEDIKGTHEVEVVMADNAATAGGELYLAPIPDMPPPPEVSVDGLRGYKLKSPVTGRFVVYLDGSISELIERTHYDLYAAAPLTSICFEADVSNQVTGYASRSLLYIPAADSVSIPCTAVAHTGGRILAKKDLAARYVESTRYKNARLTFDYESALGGDYYIRLRYMDGLGIVNKNRQYALRMLSVNGERVGIMVLSQRGPEMWTPDVDWSTMTGTTNPVAVRLHQGKNEITVSYFAPENRVEEFDHDANIVIPLALEIIKR